MRPLVTLLAASYATSLAALCAVGMRPTIPTAFLLGIVVLFVPLAYVVAETLFLIQSGLAERHRGSPPVLAGLGTIVFVGYALLPHSMLLLMLPCLLGSAWHLLTRRRQLLGPLAGGSIALVLLYGTVWNLNLLVGPFTLPRLHDDQILATDLAIYGWLWGDSITVSGMFPWHSSPTMFSVFEAAYFFLYCEVFVVILVYARECKSCARFIGGAFGAYLFALLVYCIYPVSGPHYYVPESLAETFRSTRTANLMAQMNASYEDILAGRPTAGFAYLVALPSLHVSMAVLMQGFLAISRIHFWAFLPVNVLMALSTVYLGYHYLVDVAGGVALAAAILVLNHHWEKVASIAKSPLARTITARNSVGV
jgi:membrane-associated phospholipid phosphatase